jgi:ribosomal protein L12E/L44/L45/RPP1/RPP2
MLHSKSKKMTLPLCLCVISVLLSPVITQAASETGSIAASQAADQKAALAKKAADRQKAVEEKQKAADAQKEKTDEKSGEVHL